MNHSMRIPGGNVCQRPRDFHFRACLCLVPALLGLEAIAGAGDEIPAAGLPTDKGSYSLFHPVPRNLMRPMILDRPDKTESPYTVDAGHFQMEMDLINYGWDRENGEGGDVTTAGFSAGAMNWKVGLVNHVDLQVIVQSFNRLRVDDPSAGPPVIRSGFGEVLNRLKINLWGDDGGPTALAVMPFVTWPTAGNDLGATDVEGGIVIPFAVELPAGWGLGMMTQVEVRPGAEGDGIDNSFINTVTVGHDLIGPLAAYAEFFSEVRTESGSLWIGTVDLGLTWTLSDDWILDAGINIGVTRSAPDLNPFAGLSCRF